jgi:hypothetical protein
VNAAGGDAGRPGGIRVRAGLDLPARHPLGAGMDIDEDEKGFLRDLVKVSRQKIHHVKWVDRDGTHRETALSQPEVVRLNKIAAELRVSKSEVLRQAAHVPVAKLPPRPPTVPAEGGTP